MDKKHKILHSIYISIISALIIAIVLLLVFNKKSESTELSAHQQYYNTKCDSFYTQNFNLSKNQIVFVGDSITDLFPLDDYFADLDLATYNRGIGGDNTSGLLNRLKVSIFDLKPSKIVLMIGINDVNGNVKSETILANYREILTRIQAELPNTKVYCMSLTPMNMQLSANIDVAKSNRTILEINPQLKTLVESYTNATYLDLFSHVANSDNTLIQAYSDDGIHLNSAGFEIWAKLIKPYL